jgi:hypothetical protein
MSNRRQSILPIAVVDGAAYTIGEDTNNQVVVFTSAGSTPTLAPVGSEELVLYLTADAWVTEGDGTPEAAVGKGKLIPAGLSAWFIRSGVKLAFLGLANGVAYVMPV